MKLKIIFALLLSILIVSAPLICRTVGKDASSNVNYFEFLNKFFPGSSDFTYMISYKPGGEIHAISGREANVTLIIEKLNETNDEGFYLKFIITRGFWSPYKSPSSTPRDFSKKLQEYNRWLNSTEVLAKNLYQISQENVVFKEDMTNLTINLKFTIYGWGSDWGITILARPMNGNLWVPVGGIPVNVTGCTAANHIYPYLYTFGFIVAIIAYVTFIKTRRLMFKMKKER